MPRTAKGPDRPWTRTTPSTGEGRSLPPTRAPPAWCTHDHRQGRLVHACPKIKGRPPSPPHRLAYFPANAEPDSGVPRCHPRIRRGQERDGIESSKEKVADGPVPQHRKYNNGGPVGVSAAGNRQQEGFTRLDAKGTLTTLQGAPFNHPHQQQRDAITPSAATASRDAMEDKKKFHACVSQKHKRMAAVARDARISEGAPRRSGHRTGVTMVFAPAGEGVFVTNKA